MTASAQLDGRVDFYGTRAALVAAMPNGPGASGCIAFTSDQGLQYWNPATLSWNSVSIPGAYMPAAANGVADILWKPVSSANALTFTATLAAAASSATLNANWSGNTGLYPVTLSTGQVLNAVLTNGATSCPFYVYPTPATGTYAVAGAVSSAATANATVAGQAPVVGVSNYYSVSASIAAAGTAVLAATKPDVPRNLIGAWTTSSTVTAAGLDYYGTAQTEVQTGTSFMGKKTWSAIASITSSASITGATFGTGNVLGLPFHVSSGGILAMMFNDAADAGTFVTRDLTSPATSSTGDVRGTYTPAGTLNGAKYLTALLRVDYSSQFGTLGVPPA